MPEQGRMVLRCRGLLRVDREEAVIEENQRLFPMGGEGRWKRTNLASIAEICGFG